MAIAAAGQSTPAVNLRRGDYRLFGMKPTPKTPPQDIAVGVIRSEGRFLVRLRPAGAPLEGLWEFPGGKVEAEESPEDALRREVREETGIGFREAILLHREEHAYPSFSVLLHFFLCLDPVGSPGTEAATRWVTIDELEALDMPPANRRVVAILREQFGG